VKAVDALERYVKSQTILERPLLPASAPAAGEAAAAVEAAKSGEKAGEKTGDNRHAVPRATN
jgi:hypothetical protein